ncbi:ABC transporter substrate-binding protein [Pseudonocardia sp. HH130629-09]|uniref:ABC transporter substrate-binding protein n=1 Tax=Pseudonocardia sp. HH130629-09 TaxID=1641402 RepID=UPI000B1C2034|nr:ABC transporter substrate-binding protein [Pseudonocardia sp. HH130629-09]
MHTAPLGPARSSVVATVVALVVAAMLLVAGCSAAPQAAGPQGADAAFPLTLDHAFGTTTIPARPQRVVALGSADVAVARVLGADVVGSLRNAGESQPQAPYLTPFPDGVLTISELEPLPLERIAAYRPDVILAVSSYLVTDRDAYERLSAIAPTVVYRDVLFGLCLPPTFATDPPAGDEVAPGTVALSYEEAGRLAEADLVVMSFPTPADRRRFEGNPVVARALARTTYVPIGLDEAIALQAPNVVSTGWLLDRLRPALERVAAAPATGR